MPSSTSMASTVPSWRARRKLGSSAIESSVTNPKTTLRTSPEAHNNPTSGPPYDTTVRSAILSRTMARTTAIGLRREPQPPKPMVMPGRSSVTMSSTVARLSVMAGSRRNRSRRAGHVARVTSSGSFGSVGVALLDEGPTLLVRHARHVQFIGEALLVPVAPLHVDGVDAVQRLLGAADDGRALRGDGGRHLVRRVEELSPGHDPEHRAVVVQFRGGGRLGRVHHRAHPVLWDETREVRGRAQRSPVDLRKPEGGVVRRHDDVGVPGDADPPSQAEAVHDGDHGNLAVVDRGERGGTPAVDAHECLVALGLDLFDVDAGAESPSLGP